MITLSGSNVFQFDTGVPTLRDIGVGLGGIMRFARQTGRPYPVLAHVLTCALLSEPKWSVYGLMHDATEAITSDIPTPWKHIEQRDLEHVLYERMCKAYGLPWPIPPEGQDEVNRVDLLCLVNEAYALGHGAPDKLFRRSDDDRDELEQQTMLPDPEIMELVEYHHEQAWRRVGESPYPAFLNAEISGPIFEDAFKSYALKSFEAGLEIDLDKAGIELAAP